MASELLDALIAALADTPVAADCVNQYAEPGPPGNALRRANLRLAFALARERRPDLLLVGEAPGYNGARRTGVPFTSERVLLGGVPALDQYGAERGFVLATDDGRISAEPTATIAYRELAGHGLFALGWNAYPFHPHRPGNDQSNRPPRAGEIRAGLPFLSQVLALFPDLPVGAMGNVAAQALGTLGVAHTRLRHPAQGGARIFAAGLAALAARIQAGRTAGDTV